MNTPRIVRVATCVPEHYYPQPVLAASVRRFCQGARLEMDLDLIDRFFRNVQIDGRHFALPLDDFFDPPGLGQTLAAGQQASLELGAAALENVLAASDIDPTTIAQLTCVSLLPAIPSLEARLLARLPLSRHIRRLPLSTLGCLGGAAGIARTADYLRGQPAHGALLLSLELASLLWQGSLQSDLREFARRSATEPDAHADLVSTIVTAALFSDGAGALLMVGDDHPLAAARQPAVIDTESYVAPDTEHVMGMDFLDTGFRNILRAEVPAVARAALRAAVDRLLARNQVDIAQIDPWIVHPGGPQVIGAVAEEFGLEPGRLAASGQVLQRYGNLSSATVLFLLEQQLAESPPEPGAWGLLVAMGPGLSVEVVLTRGSER